MGEIERFPGKENSGIPHEMEYPPFQGIAGDFERAVNAFSVGGDREDLKRLAFVDVATAVEQTLGLIEAGQRESQASTGAMLRLLSKLARKNDWQTYDDVDYSQIRAELVRRGFRLNPQKTPQDLAA